MQIEHEQCIYSNIIHVELNKQFYTKLYSQLFMLGGLFMHIREGRIWMKGGGIPGVWVVFGFGLLRVYSLPREELNNVKM